MESNSVLTGETNLAQMLSTLSPSLDPTHYAYCVVSLNARLDQAALGPVAMVWEDEGLTLVVPTERADVHSLEYNAVFRRITLGVHSSLEAVGLTAAVSTALAAEAISANIVAGFYHDHVFVPEADAQRAMMALNVLVT